MNLSRDELAARCYLRLLTPQEDTGSVEDWDYDVLSATAVKAADALLSALAVPPSVAAPVPSPCVADVGGTVGGGACVGAPSIYSTAPVVSGGCSVGGGAGGVVERPVPAATVPTPVNAEGRPLWVRYTGKWSADRVTPRKVQSWPTDSTPMVRCHVGNGGPITLGHDEWEPCAAPAETPAIAPTPAAALTEDDVAALAAKMRFAWFTSPNETRKAWSAAADAAAAWFAKRGAK